MPHDKNKVKQSGNENDSDIGRALYVFGPPSEKWIEYNDIREYLISLRSALGAVTINSQPGHAENVMIHMYHILFNTYKSILLLLGERFSESGNIMYRNLWEVSLILHWIAKDYPRRVKDYLDFSSVEFRSVVKLSGNRDDIDLYDSLTAKFQEKFVKSKPNSGKRTLSDNFTNKSIHDRAQELGQPWIDEYSLIYKLTSMYAHGAPAAIIHSIKQATFDCGEIEDNNQCSRIAILCARLMSRNANTLKSMQVIEETKSISLPMVGLELFLEEFESNNNRTKPKK